MSTVVHAALRYYSPADARPVRVEISTNKHAPARMDAIAYVDGAEIWRSVTLREGRDLKGACTLLTARTAEHARKEKWWLLRDAPDVQTQASVHIEALRTLIAQQCVVAGDTEQASQRLYLLNRLHALEAAFNGLTAADCRFNATPL